MASDGGADPPDLEKEEKALLDSAIAEDHDDDIKVTMTTEKPASDMTVANDVTDYMTEEDLADVPGNEAVTMEETMADDEVEDWRIDDMTRSILALDATGDIRPYEDVRRRGIVKYKHSLKGAIPIRFSKPPKEQIPVTHAGCVSLMTFSWMTSIMWKIYRKGVETIANLGVGDSEKAKTNADRLGKIWEAELMELGPKKASFGKVILRFQVTRVVVTFCFILSSVAISFIGPAFVLRSLLQYLHAGNIKLGIGIGLVVAMGVTEMGRTLVFAMSWYFNYTTGVRVRAATQTLLFRKILKLKSLQDKSVGELVNLLSNDGQRIFEAMAIGPLMLPGPIILLMGVIYLLFLIGPWSLIAMGIFFLFYPFNYFISKLTNYYRKKCIVITDRRVQMMNELLTYIKLIKMYAWEKSFAKTISVIRAKERRFLEKGAYVQSISTAVAPIVPVVAAVCMFSAYVLTGHDLTPVMAFTVVAVLNSMRFTIGVLPFAVKALADAKSSFKRFKAILLMDEMEPHPWEIFNEKHAVVLNKATFRWEKKKSDKQNGQTGNTDAIDVDITEELRNLKDTEHANGEVSFVDVPCLQNLSLMVEKGKLVGICGSVGSGKSSLISAVLGRMYLESGKVAIQGTMAYVTQQAWIMNTTVRDNILFGEEYDPVKYATVVEACSLLSDFGDFVDGDQTEIGERGINLSGGQKQRISLARAVYSDKDIMLLDDPLSAVDIHVGRHIFSECIMKVLKGKTILFVTHQLQYLSQCDNVVFLKDGMVLDIGTHDNLMKADTEYASLIKMFYTKDHTREAEMKRQESVTRQLSFDRPALMRQRTISGDSGGEQGSPSLKRDPLRQMSIMTERTMSIEEEPDDKPKGKLIVAEEKAQGNVGWPSYKAYMKSAGGYIVSILILLCFIIAIATQSFASWWLSHWLNQGSGNTSITVGNMTFVSRSITDHPNLHFYTLIYGLSIVFMVSSTAIRAYAYMKYTLRASSKMHNKIFNQMMLSPMQFFDTTPVGRIINRFSSDLDEIDVRLPSTSEMFIQNSLLILFSLGMIAYVSPWFLIALLPLIICFLILNKIFTFGVRELMRMNAITKSPMLSHVTASVQGISTIYAYDMTDRFNKKFEHLMDKNSAYFYLFYCSNRWLAVRLDLISMCVVTVTGLCIVVTYDSITPAMAGLAMSFAIQMTGLFQFTIRQAIETEAKFVAVQRLQHYANDVQAEAPHIIKDKRPPEKWPSDGEIKFEKYKMRYRDNLPLALKGIGFTIKKNEKIGIVGRSGSGKSSLGVALFRLVEPASGTIYIDGIDITQIGLEDLRSRLAIIPQDPVLFIGTVRYNLDPFKLHKDSELWEALEKCHVKDAILMRQLLQELSHLGLHYLQIMSLEKKLDHMVVENGENFSVGERQLICMARALLRNSKILMLDEATAAIDTETDALVQKTIKEAFSHCTMLIIAHRLNTVLSCNRILVMEDGRVVEYGKPADLLASSKSKFKAMLDAAEKQNEEI